ncbi:hypothetical protein [Pedobacter mendelii]|nr:hypothetical protein [Pedobacter mendelii]
MLIVFSCKKNSAEDGKEVVSGNVKQVTETVNGSTYRIFTKVGTTTFKGILVMGSGNDESNPSVGSLDGAAEADICSKAADNGYAAAIVQYRKTPGNANWNTSAKMVGEDYNQCILAISSKYGVDKNKAVVGGYSYASFMLLTDNSQSNTLTYVKGILAACGAAGTWNAQNFKIPVYSISCSGNNEGDYSGKALYDQIPANSAVKAKSEGVTDGGCNTHCGGSWTDKMYSKMVAWLN